MKKKIILTIAFLISLLPMLLNQYVFFVAHINKQ